MAQHTGHTVKNKTDSHTERQTSLLRH